MLALDGLSTLEQNKIPLWRLFLLSASGGSVDLGYAVEGAYAIPLIQAAGIHLTYATLVISLSPIIGLFFQIFLGSASDQCTCQWGRRRPFIILFAVTAALGFGLAPYSFYFEELNFSHKQYLVAVGVVACVILLDFSIGALQLPARAYLLDVVPLSQSQTGNFIFTISIGINTALGFTLGTIDWSSIMGTKVTIGNQAKIIFGITGALIFISMLLTIFSVKEIVPTDDTIVLQHSINETSSLLQQKNRKKTLSCCCCKLLMTFKQSINDVCRFVWYMSYHMWLLWLVTFLSFVAEFCYAYTFTSFVGTVIYRGDPLAPEDSYSYQQYTKGVRIGSIGLIISSIVCSLLSIGLDYVTRWIRLKTIFLIIIAYFTLCTCLLMYFQEVYQVLILGIAYGPFLGIILTVPYTLIPIYEESGMMFRKSVAGRTAVVKGKAISVINTAIFAGQIGATFSIGPIVDVTGDGNYFMLIPCVFAALTFGIALFLNKPSTTKCGSVLMMKDKDNTESQQSKKIPLWRLFLLSASGGSVDLGYAVEGAYAIPLIQAAGIHLTYATLVISLSPIIGLFFQIFLGSASDQCTCQWGRRRPFIILFAVTAALGFGLAPYNFYFEELNFSHKQYLVAVGVVACVILLDFSIGALQLPTRAYLLDVVPLSQTQTGNFIFTISIGINAALGFTLGAIDWSSAIGEKATISNQAQIVFGIAAALIFISMLLTIFSVKERETHPDVKYENGIPQDNAMYISEKDPIIKRTSNTNLKIQQKQQCFDFCSCCRIFRDSIIDVCHFIYFMSHHMWLLWLITLLSFVASFSFIYSFTSFVGTVIYRGDPLAPEDSYSYQQYTKGVRIGSIGLIISSIACSLLSIGLDYVTRWIRLKTIFLIIIAYFTLCTCLLMYFQEVYQVLILGIAYGPFLGIILTVPYTLIPIYEESGMMFRKSIADQTAVVKGKAISVINTAIFAGQIGATFSIGPIVDVTGDGNYFMLIPCVFAALTFGIALFLNMPSTTTFIN